jgi:hypothetical protein
MCGMQPHRVVREAAREVRAIVRGSTKTHEFLRDRLTAVLIVSIVVDLVCAALALVFERHANGTEVHTFGDAIFWTSTQLLTVSSQLKNPISTGGRILDVFMEAYAITVVATLAGSFGAFFHRRGAERRAELEIPASG